MRGRPATFVFFALAFLRIDITMDMKTSGTTTQGALSDADVDETKRTKYSSSDTESQNQHPQQVEPRLLYCFIFHTVTITIFSSFGFHVLDLYQGGGCVSKWQEFVIRSSAITLSILIWEVYRRRSKAIKDPA
jgi:hypothetical protein